MKRVIILFISLFLPIVCYADMSAPIIRPYQVEIINPQGAQTDENDAIIPYGSLVTVNFEYGDTVSVEYEDKYYTINIKDVRIVSDIYEIKEGDLGDSKKAVVITAREIKKGPASAYGSTGITIPSGTSIVITGFHLYALGEGGTWYYVTYKGTSGFIDIKDASVAFNHSKQEMLLYDNTEIYYNDGTKETIKANTFLKDGFYSVDPWSRMYYVSYNNKWGLIDYYKACFKSTSYDYKLKKDMKLYSTGSEKSKVIGSIDAGTIISDAFVAPDYTLRIYVENKKGWIITDEYDDVTYIEKDDAEITTTTSTTIKTTIKTVEKTVGNPKEYVIIWICVGIVISITALVTIILINKKKKTFNE